MSIPLLLVYSLRSRSAIANAAPVANLTALHTETAPAWVSDPDGRGTWSLLYSCVFTLVLCVYTAIHLNIPPPDDTRWRFCLRKAKWVAIAIFAPELVLVAACGQWNMARKLLTNLKNIASECEDEDFKRWYTADGTEKSFDMVYAHYAVMGGFAADVEEIHNVLKRVTITPDGLIFLANQGFFCRVRRKDIEDKSKANLLAKGLVILQVLWVAGQAIERKLAGFPITLLEIHTLVHVACALIMYGLWLQKPLNIQDPTIIDFRDRPEILASMLHIPFRKLRPSGFICTIEDREIQDDPEMFIFHNQEPLCINLDVEESRAEGLQDIKRRPEISNLHTSLGADNPESVPISNLLYISYEEDSGELRKFPVGHISKVFRPASSDQVVCTLYSGQALNLSVKIGPALPRAMVSPPCWSCARDLDPYTGSASEYFNSQHLCSRNLDIPVESVSMTRKDIIRLALVGKWADMIRQTVQNRLAAETESKHFKLCKHRADIRSYYHVAFSHSCISDTSRLLHINSPNWVGYFFEEDDRYGALAILPIAYGCIHLGALHLAFPNEIERLLWKISCYILIGVFVGVVAFIYSLTSSRLHKVFRKEKVDRDGESETDPSMTNGHTLGHVLKRVLRFLGGVLLLLIFAIFCLLYIAARLFLVLESFISLRHVPIGVYQTPSKNLMGYIPHL